MTQNSDTPPFKPTDDIVGRVHPTSAITTKYIKSRHITPLTPLHWVSLAASDFAKAPLISMLFGALFAIIPMAMLAFAWRQDNLMLLLPLSMAFSLIGPAFAVALYDVAWQLEKHKKPSFFHSAAALKRNAASNWGFAVLLLLLMVVWMRLAGLIYAIYPPYSNPTFESLLPFLTLGTLIGAALTGLGFAISAFTPQLIMERRVDLMTAMLTSLKAVSANVPAMVVWAGLLFAFVLLGFATAGLGFIVIMPILSYASWHGYIAVVKTKVHRNYE